MCTLRRLISALILSRKGINNDDYDDDDGDDDDDNVDYVRRGNKLE